MKFHINKNGVPVVCYATKRACPLGGETQHFDTWKEAQKYIDDHHEEKYGLLASITEEEWDPRANAGELDVGKIYDIIERTDDEEQYKADGWELRELIYYCVNVPDKPHDMVMHMRYYKDGVEIPDSSKSVNVADMGHFSGSALSEGIDEVLTGFHNGYTGTSKVEILMMEDERLEIRTSPNLEDDPSAEGIEVRYNFYYTPVDSKDLVRRYPEMVFTPKNIITFRGNDFDGYIDLKKEFEDRNNK